MLGLEVLAPQLRSPHKNKIKNKKQKNKKSLFLMNYIKVVSLKASSMHADIIPCLRQT